MPTEPTAANTASPVASEPSVRYAGFKVRLAATLIDVALLIAITFPLLYAIYGADYFDIEKTGFIAGPADFLISYVAPIVATIVLWTTLQGTPGKRVLSLRIVDAGTHGTMSARQAVVRYLAYVVSVVPLCAGLVAVAFDDRKQGWHDKLAGTVVIRSKA